LIELLAPARTAEIGREAILHGADAVYIGGPEFGARHNAGNSIADIAGLVEFAHRFHARIYVTLNTILHDVELEAARRLAHDCWDAGVDALIVQDMGLLELDLPPIDLHASTQCDIRTPTKARFLAEVGFSQLVLARELTIEEIAAVRAALPANTPASASGRTTDSGALSVKTETMPGAAPIKTESTRKQTVSRPRQNAPKSEPKNPAEDQKYDALKKAWGG